MRGDDVPGHLFTFCGTPGGYNRHRKLGQPPCEECRAAANTYRSSLRPRKTPPPGRIR